MAQSADHFEAFEDHTLLKHRILDAYLKSWAFKLLRRKDGSDRVFYVDCFAGEGRDGDGNPGSPTIACKVAIQVRQHFADCGQPWKGMAVCAIEAVPKRFKKLKEYLEPFVPAAPADLRVLQGEAADHMANITAWIGQRPALFFLDPFGVGGLDATYYKEMLAGPQSEVFALFHDLGALRLRGILHAGSDMADQIVAIKSQPSLFADEAAQIATIVAKEDQRQVYIDRNEPSARRNISRALGSEDWIEDLKHMENEAAREELVFRFIRALLDAGGQNAVLLPMRNATGTHKYCLVHVSKSTVGYVTMKEAISAGLNEESLAEDMREAMKNDLRVSLAEVMQLLQLTFGGRLVRWPRDRDEESIQWWLLSHTDVFPFQMAEIKETLKERGWIRRVDRREFCEIPTP